jgi:hypothetical protein
MTGYEKRKWARTKRFVQRHFRKRCNKHRQAEVVPRVFALSATSRPTVAPLFPSPSPTVAFTKEVGGVIISSVGVGLLVGAAAYLVLWLFE